MLIQYPILIHALCITYVGLNSHLHLQALLAQAQKRIQQVSAGVLAAAILSTAACNQAALADIQVRIQGSVSQVSVGLGSSCVCVSTLSVTLPPVLPADCGSAAGFGHGQANEEAAD